jgi:hypothetical protein
MAIWWFSGNLVYFPPVWYIVSKVWQPWPKRRFLKSIFLPALRFSLSSSLFLSVWRIGNSNGSILIPRLAAKCSQCKQFWHASDTQHNQGCQMVYFQTKNPSLGKFWRVLQWQILVGIPYGHLVYFTAIYCILWPFGTSYGYLIYFSRFVML